MDTHNVITKMDVTTEQVLAEIHLYIHGEEQREGDITVVMLAEREGFTLNTARNYLNKLVADGRMVRLGVRGSQGYFFRMVNGNEEV